MFVLFILLVAGCSSGGSKVSAGASTTSTTAASATGNQAGLDDYRACLKDHGVDLPAGQGGFGGGGGQRPPGATGGGQPPAAGAQRTPRSLPAGVDQEAFAAAQAACASKRPAGAGGGGAGGVNNTEFKAYASCLADHGVTVTTTGTGDQQRQQVDRTDPDFAAADQTCAALRPQGGRPGSTTSTTAGGQS